jgi:hypothetical protein
LVTLRDKIGFGDDLDKVLNLARKASVGLSQDKVYGLLGLLPNSLAESINPDYTLPKEKVYFQFARAILASFNKLNPFIGWCSFKVDNPMPSWIPD